MSSKAAGVFPAFGRAPERSKAAGFQGLSIWSAGWRQ
jgi:hypothetical protein